MEIPEYSPFEVRPHPKSPVTAKEMGENPVISLIPGAISTIGALIKEGWGMLICKVR